MNTPSVLIVEDEAIVAEDLANKVRQLGYAVAGTTMTGEEAVELVRQLRPSLVLMDIRLAGVMDGITAAKEIHSEYKLPVLFLTAHSDADTIMRARQAEAFGYILKPFDERDLRIQIEMALYKHTAERQLFESKERLVGINQILQAGLSCATEKDLGTACLDVAKRITQSKVGFIGDISQAEFKNLAICSTGTTDCKIHDSSGHLMSPGTFQIHGIYGRVLLDGKSLFTNDPAHHPDSIGLPEGHHSITSFLGAPLIREGRVIGLIAVANRENGYTHAEQDMLEALTPSIVEAFARKRAEAALQTLNSELERRVEQRTLELQKTQRQYLHAEKLSAIGKLSASIAHEFNNPLQGILSVLKGLKRRATLEEEDQELLDEAIHEGDRIRDLIRNLQEFNRPSPDRKTLLNLHEVLDSVLLLYKNDFKGKRISVVRHYAEHLPEIQAVSDQIKQVFLNMLTNAADACHRSGGVITLTTWQENADMVAIAIADTGIGMQPSDIDQIFQPFYTTKPEVKGTGLGLSVSYGIIKNHRGEIRVQSAPEEGATFTVLLPINDAEPYK